MTDSPLTAEPLDAWLLRKLREMLGDLTALSRAVDLPEEKILRCISGTETMPNDSFLKACDLLLQLWRKDREQSSWPLEPSDGMSSGVAKDTLH